MFANISHKVFITFVFIKHQKWYESKHVGVIVWTLLERNSQADNKNIYFPARKIITSNCCEVYLGKLQIPFILLFLNYYTQENIYMCICVHKDFLSLKMFLFKK